MQLSHKISSDKWKNDKKKIIWAKNATQWGMDKPDKNRGKSPTKDIKKQGFTCI